MDAAGQFSAGVARPGARGVPTTTPGMPGAPSFGTEGAGGGHPGPATATGTSAPSQGTPQSVFPAGVAQN